MRRPAAEPCRNALPARLAVAVLVATALSGCAARETAGVQEPQATAAAAQGESSGSTETDEVLRAVTAAIDAGRFADAERRIADQLARPGLDPQRARRFADERERMRRIRIDFPFDAEAAKARLRERIPDLREDEFADWTRRGLLEALTLDGERRWFRYGIGNLFRLSPEARARTVPPTATEPDPPLYRPHPVHTALLAAAAAGDGRRLDPQRFAITHRITVAADAVPEGATLRAWIPFPRAIADRQEDIRLLASEPATATPAPESALQRTVYLERDARAGQPTVFEIRYALTTYARVQVLDPARAALPAAGDVDAAFLAERPPHVVFTPALRAYSARALDGETRPLEVARRLFAAVDAIPWAVAREYSTLANISDHAMHAGHADCGQKTLLLIALLRLNGIPARWQSGWQFSPDTFDTMHDWGEFYLAPWGWLPMDVTHGVLETGDPAHAWFYLGGIDGYRVAFNDDWSRDFVPPKRHLRSETVDSQRGEVEWDGGNLYFDRWDYDLHWERLPAGTPPP